MTKRGKHKKAHSIFKKFSNTKVKVKFFIVLLFISADSGPSSSAQNSGTNSPDLFESQPANSASKQSTARKTPESFLGPNAALVNLDSLVSKPPQPAPSLNPFLAPGISWCQGEFVA